MNIFAISNICIIIITVVLATLLFINGKGREISITSGFFALMVALWGTAGLGISLSLHKTDAFFWWKIGYISCILSTPLYYLFICTLLELKSRLYRHILTGSYILSAIFLYFVFFKTDAFLGPDLKLVFGQFYWTDWLRSRSPIWLFYHIIFNWILLGFSFSLLLARYAYSGTAMRNKLRYFKDFKFLIDSGNSFNKLLLKSKV